MTDGTPLGLEEESEGNVDLGRGMHTKIPNTKLRDFVTHRKRIVSMRVNLLSYCTFC